MQRFHQFDGFALGQKVGADIVEVGFEGFLHLRAARYVDPLCRHLVHDVLQVARQAAVLSDGDVFRQFLELRHPCKNVVLDGLRQFVLVRHEDTPGVGFLRKLPCQIAGCRCRKYLLRAGTLGKFVEVSVEPGRGRAETPCWCCAPRSPCRARVA